MAINSNPQAPLRHVASFNSTGNIVFPAGVNQAFIQINGATGGGGQTNPSTGGHGGGGSAGPGLVSGSWVQVMPGATYAVTIGAGGQASGTGGTTSFDTVVAVSGSPGGPQAASRYGSGSPSNAHGNVNSTNTSLTTLNPGASTLARVITVTSQTTGGQPGGPGVQGFNAAATAGASGKVDIYV